jgi:hypothetical protein
MRALMVAAVTCLVLGPANLWAEEAEDSDSVQSTRAQERAKARQKARVRQAQQIMDAEPNVIQVHRAALEFFRIHPAEIERIRRMAKRRAGAPTVTVGGRYEYVDSARLVEDPIVPIQTDDDFDANVFGGSLRLEWNLPTAVFNPAELQSYALIGIQVNILKEVTRLYFVRRQLLLSLLADPPDDPRARLAMRLRVEEFTSLIDSFTGGWFSENLPNIPDL